MIWNVEIKSFILDNYLNTGHQAMADKLKQAFNADISKEQIKSFYGNHKLNSGLTGRFQKGTVPKNKGKKMCEGVYEKCKITMFKKGNEPHNHRPVGSKRIGKSRSNLGYAEVKVADPNKWRMKHVHIWEATHGTVPKGHCVIFADRDKTNFSIGNLLLVTRAELARMNQKGYIYNKAELTKSGHLMAKIETAIGERKRGNEN